MRPRVLMYHFFGEVLATGDPENLFVSRDALVEQLSWLRDNGWTALTLDQYLAALDGAATPRRAYLFTIDDAHASALEIAAPILAKAGVPAVLHVPPGLAGGTVSWSKPAYAAQPLLDAKRLKEISQAGVELGVHGHDHTRLRGLSRETLTPHTTGARQLLTELTGVVPRAFAYPYGTWDVTSRRSVAEAGYLAGFAVAREGGRYAIDRVGIFRQDSLATFRFKLSPAYRLASRVAGKTWRLRHAVRRLRGN